MRLESIRPQAPTAALFEMDASENEIDVYLHKHSKILLDELDQSLVTCLRKPDGRGGTRIRPWVRIRETLKATSVSFVGPTEQETSADNLISVS